MSIQQSTRSTPSKVYLKKLEDLKSIVSAPGKNRSVVGVILDATGTYKTDDSYDFICKIKMIDNTHNPTLNQKLEVDSFVQIFIFSTKFKSSPIIRKIGDILLLRSFYFDNYNNTVKAINNKKVSDWFLFDGQENSPLVPLSMSKDYRVELTQKEKEKITYMRRWAKHYFANNHLETLFWFKSELPQKMRRNSLYLQKDIDILVKVLCFIKCFYDNQFYYKVMFVDQFGKQYISELQNKSIELVKGAILKLRSVQIVTKKNSHRINFFEYSDILELPSYFRNSKEIEQATKDLSFDQKELELKFLEELHIDKYQKKQLNPSTFMFVSPHEQNILVMLEKFKKEYAILKQFKLDVEQFKFVRDDTIKNQIGSLIKKEHENLPISSIGDLLENLNECSENDKNFEKYKEKYFRVKATISKVHNETISSSAQIFCKEQKQVWPMKDLKNAKNQGEALQIIFYNTFTLKEKDKELLIYIATYDNNPQYIFDLWNILPSIYDVQNYSNLQSKKFKEFNYYLKKLQSKTTQYEFVLQMIKNKSQHFYYRIIDSIFWFPQH